MIDEDTHLRRAAEALDPRLFQRNRTMTQTAAQRVLAAFDKTVTVEGGITEDLTLTDDLGLDSLELMQVAVDLEAEFGVDLTAAQIEGWQTVGDVINTFREGA